MSCALFSCGLICDGRVMPDASSLACPYVGLSNGLHAMAQPLTVLQGALGAWKLRGAYEAGNDRYLEMSARQVERMSDLLGCMQDILETATGEPECGAVDPAELLELVLEGLSSTVREWGGKIERAESNEQARIWGDAKRTERALRAALRAAISVSAPGGAFRLSTRLQDGQVELVVDMATGTGRKLNSTERLNLSLVEANTRSQGGGASWVEDPFCLTITLPAHDRESVGVLFADRQISIPSTV
jgi:hypothetical protein